VEVTGGWRKLLNEKFNLVLSGVSLPLREEYRMRVFENKFLGRIFGRKREEVTGGWRKVNYEKLYHILLGLSYQGG
jgi:hypothetical protein